MNQTALPWIMAGALLLSVASTPGADRKYIVKKSDTLTAIARRHGMSISALLKANPSVDHPNKIYIGQVLRIPSSAAAEELDSQLLKTLNRTKLAARKWKYIVIHHSATEVGNLKSMDRYHREERHMENGLAYHFIIGNGKGMGDGEIAIGPRWTGQLNGGHLASEALNAKSIGVCLVGNFDETKPSAKQMESLQALTAYLLKRCGLASGAIKTHQEINTVHTHCPGKHFPAQSFLKEFQISQR